MISYLLTSTINEVYRNSFRIAHTSSEILLGSIGKFLYENTLLLADIYITCPTYFSMCDMYDDFCSRRNRISTTIPYKPSETTPTSKIYEKFMILPRMIGAGIAFTASICAYYPLFLTIPVVGIRILKNIHYNKLHILKLCT